MGYETGVDLEKLAAATRALASVRGRAPSSRVFAAMEAQRRRESGVSPPLE